MALIGGYAIIDLRGLDCKTEKTIKGIYDSISNAQKKPCLVSGINYDGTAYNPQFVGFYKSGTSWVCALANSLTLTVASDDGCTIE